MCVWRLPPQVSDVVATSLVTADEAVSRTGDAVECHEIIPRMALRGAQDTHATRLVLPVHHMM